MPERPSTPTPASLSTIWIGMPVIDVTSRLIGAVRYVKPPAGTVARPAIGEDLESAFARALADREPEIDAGLADELARDGFFKVAGLGPMDHDVYVLADQVAVVDEEVVRLCCAVEELAAEREDWN